MYGEDTVGGTGKWQENCFLPVASNKKAIAEFYLRIITGLMTTDEWLLLLTTENQIVKSTTNGNTAQIGRSNEYILIPCTVQV